ncbi:hypothetical protein ACHAWX_006270 [Stephanocyclus meneghinianus]
MSSRSRRSCRYRQPPANGLVSFKQPPSNSDAQSTSGASRWSIRSTSTWATIKKQRFSGINRGKQPSASSFAAAVKRQAEKDDDNASVASMNATEPLLGMTHSLPFKKRVMRSSPFTFKTSSSSTSRLSFVTGMGKSAAPHTNDASIQHGRKRWKPMSCKITGRIPSKVVLNMTKQTFSYDSFSSSPGTASPPLHVESTPAENSAQVNSDNFFENSFEFDEHASFIGDLSIPNLFLSLETSEHEVEPMSYLGVDEPSTATSESNPLSANSLPRIPSDQCFIPSFNSIATFEVASDEGAEDQEHVLSASAGIKFFESLQKNSSSHSSFVPRNSPSSLGSWKYPTTYSAFTSPSSNSAFSPNSTKAFKSPQSNSAFSPSNCGFTLPSNSGFKLPGVYCAYKSTESSVFKLPSSCKINECTEDCDTNSQSSMPSISDSSSKGGHHQVTLQQDSTSDKDPFDAVIAWTALGAVMGSPAPQSVLRAQKKRRGNESSNLWIDDNSTEELDEIVINIEDIDLGGASMSCPTSGSESQANTSSCSDKFITTLEQRINFLARLSRDANDADSELIANSSIPDAGDLSSIAPPINCEVKPVFNSDIDSSQCCNVNASSPADESNSDSVLDLHEDNFSTESVTAPGNSKDVASSAIAWGALAALLGSPAPSCVLQKKDRSAAINLWSNCSTADGDEIISLPCSESDELFEDNISAALFPQDIELNDELSLSGLQIESNDSCVVRKNEDNASSVLAWSALAALLGSPAPSCVLQKQSRPVMNLWADVDAHQDDDLISLSHSEESFIDDSGEGGIGHLGSPAQAVNDSVDDLSLSSLQFDLCDSCQQTELTCMSPKKDEITNSTIAWGALTALLGLPAPSCVLQKNRRSVKNFWADDDVIFDDDLISLAPSEGHNCGDLCGKVAHDVELSLKESECIDDLSLSALQFESGDIYGGEDETHLTQKQNDITTPTIAWGALTALLGLPAPSCVLHKGNRQVKNLWAGDEDNDSLVSLAHSQDSCIGDSDSVPSLVAESHVGSYPSSPSIHNVSSCDSVSPFKENNAVINSFIEWGQ